MYAVKEIYKTLQGEGAHSGRAAVFLRFAGCNLWSGLERDRATAVCRFCDTDFVGTGGVGGGRFADAVLLALAVERMWQIGMGIDPSPAISLPDIERSAWPAVSAAGKRSNGGSHARVLKYVVCTGGEPLLQLDGMLIEALHACGFEIAIETNGTLTAPAGIDWICVSPKAAAPLVQTSGSELKLVFPQPDAPPSAFEDLDFEHFFLQPMDGGEQKANIEAAAGYCLTHPQWRLSLQTHKMIGLP